MGGEPFLYAQNLSGWRGKYEQDCKEKVAFKGLIAKWDVSFIVLQENVHALVRRPFTRILFYLSLDSFTLHSLTILEKIILIFLQFEKVQPLSSS